jgi:hypothetical protein
MTDGCVHLLYNISWKFLQLAAGQLLSGQPVRYGGKGKRYGPSITYKITPAGSLSSSPPGGPPFWASTLAFGLIGMGHSKKQLRAAPHCHLWPILGSSDKWLSHANLSRRLMSFNPCTAEALAMQSAFISNFFLIIFLILSSLSIQFRNKCCSSCNILLGIYPKTYRYFQSAYSPYALNKIFGTFFVYAYTVVQYVYSVKTSKKSMKIISREINTVLSLGKHILPFVYFE